jgi:nicotinate-nucleotide pyrophosphorylase (carboxylating)
VEDAVARARREWPGRSVQVECDRPDQVKAALVTGADLVLLDNMSPAQVAECVGLVAAAGPVGAGRCLVEVSGGVTLETVEAYAAAGPDLISVGVITHSAPSLDVGLDLARGD